MISEAYISAQIHSAVYRHGGDLFILEAGPENGYRSVPLRAIDINGFLLADPEVHFYKDVNWTFDELRSVLDGHIAKHEALDLFLTGMDTSYSDEIRKEAIEILAEDYYGNPAVRAFITNRIFGTSKPDIFDPLSAAGMAKEIGHNELHRLYTDLSHATELIVTAREAWKRTLLEQEPTSKNLSVLDRVFTDEGILAGFVLAKLKQDHNAFDSIVIKHANTVGQLGIAQAPVFLTAIKQLIDEKHPWPRQGSNALTDEHEEMELPFAARFYELIDSFEGKTRRKQQSRKSSGPQNVGHSTLLEKISGLIEWIRQQIAARHVGEAEGGILQLIELQNVNSNPEHICKSLCDLAQAYQNHGNIEDADLLAKGAIKVFSLDPVPHCILAENFRKTNKLPEALAMYETTIAQFGNDVVAFCGKAETLRAMGKLPEALAMYEATITQFENDVVAFCGKAETLRALGRLPEALAMYEVTIAQFGNDVVAFCGKAETLRAMGKLPEALAMYEATIAQFGNDEVARNGKAETLRAMGRLPEALETYEATIAQFGYDVVAYCGKAETLRAMGRLPEALAMYEATIAQFGNSVVAFCGKAETLRALGKLPEALAMYEATIAQFGNSVVAFCGKAETLRAMGRLPEALAVYEATIAQFRNDVVAFCGKAETLRAMGKLPEALAMYEATIAQFGNNDVARNGKAETLRAMGKLPEALAMYEATIAHFGNDEVARNGKAETLRAMGKLPEALAVYEATIAQFGNDVVAFCGKAETLRAIGKLPQALAVYEATIAQFGNNAVAKMARLGLLLQMNRDVKEVIGQINISEPHTDGEWRKYHMYCMWLLKQGKMDEAIHKLRYGVKRSHFVHGQYFRGALSFALIKKKEYAEARQVLNEFNVSLPVKTLFATHIIAAEKNIGEARKQIDLVIRSPYKKIKEASEYLSDRYSIDIGRQYHKNMSKQDLEAKIEALEFDLLTDMQFSMVA